jgi:hypothetical protein
MDVYEFVVPVSLAGTQSSIYLKLTTHSLPKEGTWSLRNDKTPLSYTSNTIRDLCNFFH